MQAEGLPERRRKSVPVAAFGRTRVSPVAASGRTCVSPVGAGSRVGIPWRSSGSEVGPDFGQELTECQIGCRRFRFTRAFNEEERKLRDHREWITTERAHELH